MSDLKCQKCFRSLTGCQACRGGRATGGNCSRCTDGLVCPSCGKFWKR